MHITAFQQTTRKDNELSEAVTAPVFISTTNHINAVGKIRQDSTDNDCIILGDWTNGNKADMYWLEPNKMEHIH